MPLSDPVPQATGAPARLSVRVISSLSEVDATQWDALTSPDDPFTTHAFLSLMEESGSVGPGTGWLPAHLLVEAVPADAPEGAAGTGTLVGAAPLYVKDHSYGEYIFDWGWAEASQRARVPYYPKVVSAVPFTPATGRRFMVARDVPEGPVLDALLIGARKVAELANAWSIHVLFQSSDEHHALVPQQSIDSRGFGPRDLVPRMTHQFHWTNDGYADFDDWLGHFRSKVRKEARRERRKARASGAELVVVPGTQLEPAHWHALHAFYQDTASRKWGRPYLTEKWWALAPARLAHLALGFFAMKGDRAVAGALTFQRGRHLYGRYWGCLEHHDALHFELCYHLPIELCIQRGWTRFEAGAQGNHKLRRGLMPHPTWSVHWLRHAGLGHAVAEAMTHERRDTARLLAHLADRGPFRPSPGC